jgi:hypothetical protein
VHFISIKIPLKPSWVILPSGMNICENDLIRKLSYHRDRKGKQKLTVLFETAAATMRI